MALAVLSVVDTNRFGHRIFRAEASSVDEAIAVDEGARHDRAELLITRCSADQLGAIHALEARQHRLMDTLIHYSGRTYSDGLRVPADDVRPATREDSESLRRIATDCFTNYGGHYHADPRLNAELATLGYVDWCLSSLESRTDRVLVATTNQRPIGFLTFRNERPGDPGEIVLNGVATSHRGRGVYGLLVGQCLRLLAHDGVRTVEVSTQISNFAPQRAWARHGLRPFKAVHTFHKWFGVG